MGAMKGFRVAAAAIAIAASTNVGVAADSFVVANDSFMYNGEPITIRSGSFHYHRAHYSTWEDRMKRMAAMGLNALQTCKCNTPTTDQLIRVSQSWAIGKLPLSLLEPERLLIADYGSG